MDRVLIVGGGGREHALAWRLAQEVEVHVCPGNPGTALVGINHPVPVLDILGVVALAGSLAVDLVVVGPEDPLIAGLGDALRERGFAVVGPGADGAQLEGSKAFSKELMAAAGVPTAAFGTFVDAGMAADFARSRFDAGMGVAVKASGAALGKGVVVCTELEMALDAIEMMLVDGELGIAGNEIVIEDRLEGREFSLLTLVNESGILSLPIAQDYKRIFDSDRGPNTGGMGTYSPVGWVPDSLVATVEDTVVRPIVAELLARGTNYRGVLFAGLMVHEGRATCLEYNVRFGDPETQTVMRRVGTGFYAALTACANGTPIPACEVLPTAAVTVVAASAGYPGDYPKGRAIVIGELESGTEVFHAGTALSNGTLFTSGGRVLGVSAVGPDLSTARAAAYRGIAQISFEGMQFRRDIGG